jgi:hypothetical protein
LVKSFAEFIISRAEFVGTLLVAGRLVDGISLILTPCGSVADGPEKVWRDGSRRRRRPGKEDVSEVKDESLDEAWCHGEGESRVLKLITSSLLRLALSM